MIKFEPIGQSTLRASLRLSADPERVFRAWTDPSEIVKWFRGSPDGRLEVHSFDCREGGSYDVTMVTSSGDRLNLFGTYLKVEPNRRLVMTWTWGFGPKPMVPMRVTVDIVPSERGSLLTITHEGFDSPETRDRHELGWTPALANLGMYLGDKSDSKR